MWPSLVLIFCSLAAAGSYLTIGLGDRSGPALAWWKASPCILLAVAALFWPTLADDKTAGLFAALSLSAMGDLFLAFAGRAWFKRGLLSFLTAHIIYAGLFSDDAPAGAWSSGPVLVTAGLISLLTILLLARLWQNLGALRFPVVAYCLAIAIMILAAVASGNVFLIGGALLFALSDLMIAIREFHRPFPFARHAIWLTYFPAQLLIFVGVVG